MAILKKTVNDRLLRNQIDDMSESWLAFKDKMRSYLHKSTFPTREAKNQVKVYYVNKKDACGIIITSAEHTRGEYLSKKGQTFPKC